MKGKNIENQELQYMSEGQFGGQWGREGSKEWGAADGSGDLFICSIPENRSSKAGNHNCLPGTLRIHQCTKKKHLLIRRHLIFCFILNTVVVARVWGAKGMGPWYWDTCLQAQAAAGTNMSTESQHVLLFFPRAAGKKEPCHTPT